MRQRIFVLVNYFLRNMVFSLGGLLFVIVTLAFWSIFFPPQQATPEVENYVLIIGLFGTAMTFLTTLSITARANQAKHYPLLVRLPSRLEYLTAVLLSALIYATSLQLVLALLALLDGPDFSFGRALEIPPIWLAPNILAGVMALHASDFVTRGWSRVSIYGVLALLLLSQDIGAPVSNWLGRRFDSLSRFFFDQDLNRLSDQFDQWAVTLLSGEPGTISKLFGSLFWPFRAISSATVNGYFDTTQALAPAVILLYATILFLLAADFFATKDLDFTE